MNVLMAYVLMCFNDLNSSSVPEETCDIDDLDDTITQTAQAYRTSEKGTFYCCLDFCCSNKEDVNDFLLFSKVLNEYSHLSTSIIIFTSIMNLSHYVAPRRKHLFLVKISLICVDTSVPTHDKVVFLKVMLLFWSIDLEGFIYMYLKRT